MSTLIEFSNPVSVTGLASHLIYVGLLAPDAALQFQQNSSQIGISFISYIVKNNILSSEKILQSCVKHFGLSIFDLKNYEISWLHHSGLSAEIICRYRIIPLKKQNNILQIGISDPTDSHALNAVSFYTGLSVLPYLIAEDQIDHFIEHHFNKNSYKNLELSLINELNQEENSRIVQENIVNYDAPLIRFVDHIIQHARQQHASDIHVEPYEKICRIRYRLNGILYETAEIPSNLAERLVTRLKVMARLDISERRLPQDGRFQFQQIDIRISTCPTIFGEKIVLRLLELNKFSFEIDALGFTESQKKLFIEKISQPQGLILVTGPTGSGKTVTLYSALRYLNNSEKNISTVEDPVEIQLKGINQVNIHPKINLHFSTVLRTFLRQDPDIIMVGEIRDQETAEIAIQAAQTGHLVLSTLHTNNAIETIIRLGTMKIPPYNIVSSLSLIIAQRLVRKLCLHCKQPEIIPKNALNSEFNITDPNLTLYQAVGCQHCLQGYQGRIGIYELLPNTSALAQSILSHADNLNLAQQARFVDNLSLRDAAFEKVSQGVTSLTEMNRVIQK